MVPGASPVIVKAGMLPVIVELAGSVTIWMPPFVVSVGLATVLHTTPTRSSHCQLEVPVMVLMSTVVVVTPLEVGFTVIHR